MKRGIFIVWMMNKKKIFNIIFFLFSSCYIYVYIYIFFISNYSRIIFKFDWNYFIFFSFALPWLENLLLDMVELFGESLRSSVMSKENRGWRREQKKLENKNEVERKKNIFATSHNFFFLVFFSLSNYFFFSAFCYLHLFFLYKWS